MGKMQNYVPNEFGQINLEDGTKIMVSLSPSDMKIFQLGFLGYPKQTLYNFDELSINRISLLNNDVLQFVYSQLLSASSLKETIDICKSIDELLNNMFKE